MHGCIIFSLVWVSWHPALLKLYCTENLHIFFLDSTKVFLLIKILMESFIINNILWEILLQAEYFTGSVKKYDFTLSCLVLKASPH